jgi:hypothetical protein
VLTVATTSGQLLSFLAALPVVFDYHGSKVMHLTSLMEMSVQDLSRKGGAPMVLEVEVEPAFCGLGPEHAAVGINNQVRSVYSSRTHLLAAAVVVLGSAQPLPPPQFARVCWSNSHVKPRQHAQSMQKHARGNCTITSMCTSTIV